MKLKKSTRKLIDNTALWLLAIGGFNWLLSLFSVNIIDIAVGLTAPIVGTILISGIGIASLWVGGRAVMGKFLK